MGTKLKSEEQQDIYFDHFTHFFGIYYALKDSSAMVSRDWAFTLKDEKRFLPPPAICVAFDVKMFISKYAKPPLLMQCTNKRAGRTWGCCCVIRWRMRWVSPHPERAPPGDLTHLISFYASSPLSISTSRSFVVSAARDRMSAISASSSFLRTCCTRSSCFLKGEKGRRGRNVNPSSIIISLGACYMDKQ